MDQETDGAWQQRYKTEQILEVGCPKCGAAPHKWCVRDGEKLSRRGQSLTKAGTPPSHQERMWIRQGHAEHEIPGLIAKQHPGWDEDKPKAGKRAVRSAARGGCTPCASERAIRASQQFPGFPVDFPCPHPVSGPVPRFPVRYTGQRTCPECAILVPVEVAVQDPVTVGYRCDRGHMWLLRPVRPVKVKTNRPVPVLAGKTGSPVADDADWPPWEQGPDERLTRC